MPLEAPASSRLEGLARLHLCQEDSNLLAQDRGVPDCHRRVENAVELGRSPGELNRVAESNCAREPARQAGRCELQRHNRRTSGGAAKGSRGGWYRRRILTELPGSQTGLARGAWGGTSSPNRTLLAAGKNGLWARVRKQGITHCRPMHLRTRRKRKLLFFE